MKKGIWLALLAVALTAVIIVLPVAQSELAQKKTTSSSAVEKSNRNIIEGSDKEPLQTKDGSGEVRDETITFLVLLSEPPLIDKALTSGRYGSVKELILSADGKTACDAVRKSQAVAKASIKKLVPEASLEGGRTFSALFNGVTVKAPAAAREKLKKIKGVSAVYAVKDDCEFFDNGSSDGEQTRAAENADKLTQAQRASAGLDDGLHEQYGGTGMLIAVIDSGFDTAAEVFSEYPQADNMSPSVISELNKRISFNTAAESGAASVYVSPKIVFAYDYAGNDPDTGGEGADHGTAAASIAAGNNGEADGIRYKGIAYDAQLALMRVADSSGRISTAAFLAALDDSVKLGADIVNIGFGSYSQSELSELLGYAFEKMRGSGTTVTAAAGNGAYNGSYTGEKPAAADIFYSAENVLSMGGAVSAASMENTVKVKRSVMINGAKLYYTDLGNKMLTSSVRSVENIGTALGRAEHRAQYNEYIYADISGERAALPETGCKDRMIVLDASGLTAEDIEELCVRAAEIGAVSAALTGLSAETELNIAAEIPVVSLEGAERSLFASQREGTFTIDLDGEVTDKDKLPGISEFSSYGVSDDLDIGVKMTAVGEDILAADADGGFELISGTSAAVPVVSGAYAVLKQYVKSTGAALSGQSSAELAADYMLSSALPVKFGQAAEGETALYYSPRLQGFGALNVNNALAVRARFYSTGGLTPVSLGDSEENVSRFSFTLVNDADEARVFSLSCAVQTDKAGADGSGRRINTLEPLSLAEASAVIFRSGEETVTEIEIAAGASADITAEITLDEKTVSELKEAFTAGFYIEGYVFAAADGAAVSLPYMGFYGSLENAAVFDSTVYDEDSPAAGYESSLVAAAYKNGSHAASGLIKYDDRLLFSAEAVRSSEDDTSYSSAVILPDLYTLCNAYDLTVRIYDASEKLLFTENMGMLSSHRYAGSAPYERLSPGKSFRDLFAKLSRGRYRYEISAKNMLSNGRLSAEKKISYMFELDNLKPEGVSSQTVPEGDRLYLELTASDSGGIRDFELYGAGYDSRNDKYSYIDSLDSIIEAGYISESAYSLVEKRVNEDGSFTFRYDITELSRELKKLSVNTDTWQVKSLYKKIAYKAIDNAGNPSEVRLADAIEYGSAEFIFTDQNGMPVSNIGVKIGKSIIYSDSSGRAFFEKIEPNYYNARLIYDKTLYGIDRSGFLVSITKDEPEYRAEQTVEFYGTYPENSKNGEMTVEKTRADVFAEEQDKDEPAFAFVFVGSVLIVCVMLFILRKRKGRRSEQRIENRE